MNEKDVVETRSEDFTGNLPGRTTIENEVYVA